MIQYLYRRNIRAGGREVSARGVLRQDQPAAGVHREDLPEGDGQQRQWTEHHGEDEAGWEQQHGKLDWVCADITAA